MPTITSRARHETPVRPAPTVTSVLEPEVGSVETEPFVLDEEFVREDEFTCRRCRMIVPRTEMADASGRVCVDCLVRELEPV